MTRLRDDQPSLWPIVPLHRRRRFGVMESAFPGGVFIRARLRRYRAQNWLFLAYYFLDLIMYPAWLFIHLDFHA